MNKRSSTIYKTLYTHSRYAAVESSDFIARKQPPTRADHRIPYAEASSYRHFGIYISISRWYRTQCAVSLAAAFTKQKL